MQIIEMTTISSHSGSQALGEVCNRLVDVFLWQLFPDGLQNDFPLINRLGFWVSLWHYSARRPRCDSPVGSNLESLWTNDYSQ